ncbi:MAG: polyprenyl synthetase family protein [Cryobacterium sp.]|nr:polyprenyl synthetase family protein [Oligoflexia bacterium]
MVDKDFRDDWALPWFDSSLYTLGGKGALTGLEGVIDASVLRGGKRLRPLLMGEFARFFGLPFDAVIPYARAAEQVHSATLAHDDVIDESSTRRGSLTLNARIENRKAILAGDYLLAEGIYAVSKLKNAAIVEGLAATLRELVTGELLQNEARGISDVSSSHLSRVADLKTASLFRWCCLVPAHLSNAPEPVIALTREFATRIGVAFQWIDDAVDFSLSSGKPYAADLREGLVNRVTFRLLEIAPHTQAWVQRSLSSNSSESLPWTPEEIQSAVEDTRSAGRAQMGAARRNLSDLISAMTHAGQAPSQESSQRIERILQRLEERLL